VENPKTICTRITSSIMGSEARHAKSLPTVVLGSLGPHVAMGDKVMLLPCSFWIMKFQGLNFYK
jgi:hypothetical protein